MTDLADRSISVAFDDNRLVPLLYGEHDTNLLRIEHQLGVSLASRGNQVTIRGGEGAADRALLVLNTLWERLGRGLPVAAADVDTVIRFAEEGGGAPDALKRSEVGVRTKRRVVTARSGNQASYIEALESHDLVLGLGPAGTGKTYLAVAQAVAMLIAGRVDRIILSRPAVEAGERLGFLPGDLKEKVDPYLRPLYDALHDMLPPDQVAKHMETGVIEIAPLAFMRGRTLSNAYVILDEGQNATAMQMRMFLTRLGENSRMVVTGDISQIDLPPGVKSGLKEAIEILDGVEGVAFVRFDHRDVVRHALVTRIVRAYDALDRKRREGSP
ncbi:PhoH family protein [Inquilinus sp. CAU 1745]|uniref:PhoH family protein n=1 Tax=Inquilinus sp. CAU 1745 TaxID=3140369 RepID=UPI00325A8CF1